MDWNVITKYSGTAALLASIFFLVLTGKVDPHEYVTIVIGMLTGIGVYHSTMATPPTPEKTDEKVPPPVVAP